MRKRILILKASGGSDEPHECNGICEQAQLYGIESVCKCVKNNEDLEGILYSHGLFDYIYLSAHGNYPDLPADLLCAWSETKLDFCRYAYLLRHLTGYHHCICVNQLISVGKNWEILTSTHATYQCL